MFVLWIVLPEAHVADERRNIGIKSYDVSLENQTATVVAGPELEYEKVLQTIAKTGKKVNSGSVDGEERSVELPKAE